ncbi:hypothetical protein Moror_14296 [Moniliophthora roreri MCA 2997]|uniref:F-box domain-containing protein n=2 Tax=Moniliophthora roreri TaxID=221103 RepID=V2XQ72_MONRO|nr:hypothetical protein Moror_14296 [Moniliophthora roreri MCA 2997]KAI3615075.1 hypothetical protein WG66_017009 [Moniliophthora roreri]
MVVLPVELWLHIVDFLSPEALKELLGVNSFFYNIAMNLRYKRVELQTLNTKTSKYLTRLSDPHVSKRVVQLTVSPDFRNYGRVKSPSMLDIVGHAVQYALGRTPPKPEAQATKTLIDVLPGLTSVHNYTIDCHSWGTHSSPELHTFLGAAWNAFGHNIRKLSLRGHASAFKTIIDSTSALPLVTELFLELIDNPLQFDPMDPETLLQVIAPFVNGLASQLQVWTLWSWGTIDLSHFFMALGLFPRLKKFNLQTSFPKTFRLDPSGLTRFLASHASDLEHLVLRLNTTPLAFSTTSEQPLSDWMNKVFSSAAQWRFSNLRELHMYPTVLPGGFSALTSCIGQSAGTLQGLVVRDRYLSPEEVILVIDALPPHLKSLRLNIRVLNIEIFDHAAKMLGGLKSLSLYIGSIAPTFASDIERRLYSSWHLHHIGIWHAGSYLDSHLMCTISRSIPSVRHFWGNKNDIEDFGLR